MQLACRLVGKGQARGTWQASQCLHAVQMMSISGPLMMHASGSLDSLLPAWTMQQQCIAISIAL